VSGDVRRSNQTAEAQQYPPTHAESAPRECDGAGETAGEEVRWVGQQHRMQGFCGRATDAGAGVRRPELSATRPVVMVQRPGRTVVRIGPRPVEADDYATATAA
jgi:hypothetical protein